jgi:hypothetical protein
MSFFWMIMVCVSIINVCSGIFRGDYGIWFYIDIISGLGSAYFYRESRIRELQEAEAKRQFVNIVINHMGNEDAEKTAKRIAEDLNRRGI